MSNYKRFGVRAEQIARDALLEYQKAESAVQSAYQNKKRTPVQHGVVSAEYAAKAARAEAEYQEALAAREAARRSMVDKGRELKAIRDELASAVSEAYAVNPDSVDGKTLELLKSGILDSTDFSRLFSKSVDDGNYTMARLICKHAGDAADKRANDGYHGNDRECQSLRYVSTLGAKYTGAEYIETFDAITDTFNRCINNPTMIDSWDSLTAPMVENM